MLSLILLFSLLGSIGALLLSGLLLIFPESIRYRLVPDLVSYATGTLLGAAFLGMIPTGLEQAPAFQFSATLLGGIVLFFLLEKLVLWRHSHDEQPSQRTAAVPLILIGDGFHNLVDGIVIASAFLMSIPLGLGVSLAIIAHEIPQEVGDFAILLDNGVSRGKALFLNGLASVTTLPGALLAYFWLDSASALIPFVLALSSASFIYLALSDLTPGLRRDTGGMATLRQFILLIAGIGTIAIFHHGK